MAGMIMKFTQKTKYNMDQFRYDTLMGKLDKIITTLDELIKAVKESNGNATTKITVVGNKSPQNIKGLKSDEDFEL